MKLPQNKEKRALMISALSAALFATAGLLAGAFLGSQVILFDGAYSLLSLGLSLLSLGALRLVSQPADADFPFGRLLAEPLAIAVKGLIILLVCLVSLVSASHALMTGGREVAADMALLFGIVNVAGCALTWHYLARCHRAEPTALLAAERRQWQMDTVISAAVLMGFGITALVARSPAAHLAVYADPLMLIAAAGYFIRVPLCMVRDAWREIFVGSPAPELAADIRARLAQLDPLLADAPMGKVGSHLILDASKMASSRFELRQLRREIRRQLQGQGLTVSVVMHR
ncbi:MAG: cation transporter [Marinobacter sp.]|nr:cation transporter [Marinobacter sp.]